MFSEKSFARRCNSALSSEMCTLPRQERGYGMAPGQGGWACRMFVAGLVQAAGDPEASRALHLLESKGAAAPNTPLCSLWRRHPLVLSRHREWACLKHLLLTKTARCFLACPSISGCNMSSCTAHGPSDKGLPPCKRLPVCTSFGAAKQQKALYAFSNPRLQSPPATCAAHALQSVISSLKV